MSRAKDQSPTETAGADDTVVWTAKRRPTINDVARLARVSKKTVSRVINQSPFVRQETRARVQAVIDQIAYEPDPQARGLASQRSYLLGMVYDNPNARFIIDLQDGTLRACRAAGYELVVHLTDRSQPDFVRKVRQFAERQKLDGVVLTPPVSENNELAAALAEAGVHYVRIVSVDADEAENQVRYLDWMGAAEAAEHLVSLGHRRIGLVKGPESFCSAHERERGFVEGLRGKNIKFSDELRAQGDYGFESGVTAGNQLLDLPERPTAIFASNDEMAAGVYRAALVRGLTIPGDLSIVGFDDSALASRLWPALTTVRQPIQDMGRMAAECLIRRMAKPGDDTPGGQVTARLVVRESTAAPAAKR